MRSAWLLTFVLVACPASDDEPAVSERLPSTLRDTTGAEFELVGGNPDNLRVVSGAALPPACGGEPATEFAFWLGKTGLSMICAIDPETGAPFEVLCRPIACAGASECTPAFACVEGSCRCPSGPCLPKPGNGRVDDDELVALCLADRPRSMTCPIGLEDAWVAGPVEDSCDEDTDLCTIPKECR
jgi:hypothetical protein